MTEAMTSWNGPICTICGARYLGTHSCSNEDLVRKITELSKLIKPNNLDPMKGCPCKPENGGSGICGCILSGPRVTC